MCSREPAVSFLSHLLLKSHFDVKVEFSAAFFFNNYEKKRFGFAT